MMPMKTKSGTATSWSSSMVSLNFKVSRKKPSFGLMPQAAKTNERKIRVNEIGKPTKMANNMAPTMKRPIVGLSRPVMPTASPKPVK